MKKEKRMVDLQTLTAKLNKFRMEKSENLFTADQLIDELKQLGFSVGVSCAIRSLFDSEKVGKARLYKAPITPIKIGQLENIYNRMNSYGKKYREKKTPDNTSSIEEAMKAIKAAGYRISQPVFDIDRFIRENPELVKKYTIYKVLD